MSSMTAGPLVLVAGMHRSGTSALTRVLNLLGLSLGDERELMAPQPDNPEGFWEARDVARMNDRLLLALGGSWDSPPRTDWPDAASLLPWRQEAAELIDRLRSDGEDAHALKDPRFSLTLPLWRSVAPEAKVVLPVRTPLAVAQSLQRRNGIPLAEGARLWLRYVREALAAAPDAIIVDYGRVLSEPEPTVRSLVQRLGLRAPSAAQLAEALGSLKPELDHGQELPPSERPVGLTLAELAYGRIVSGSAQAVTGSAFGARPSACSFPGHLRLPG